MKFPIYLLFWEVPGNFEYGYFASRKEMISFMRTNPSLPYVNAGFCSPEVLKVYLSELVRERAIKGTEGED